MSNVGEIYNFRGRIFVITKKLINGFCHVVYTDGKTCCWGKDFIRHCDLVKSYPSWREAAISSDFEEK